MFLIKFRPRLFKERIILSIANKYVQEFPHSPIICAQSRSVCLIQVRGLCGKLARSVVWSTFAPLDSDLSTG